MIYYWIGRFVVMFVAMYALLLAAYLLVVFGEWLMGRIELKFQKSRIKYH